jgi:hypothetical protein
MNAIGRYRYTAELWIMEVKINSEGNRNNYRPVEVH